MGSDVYCLDGRWAVSTTRRAVGFPRPHRCRCGRGSWVSEDFTALGMNSFVDCIQPGFVVASPGLPGLRRASAWGRRPHRKALAAGVRVSETGVMTCEWSSAAAGGPEWVDRVAFPISAGGATGPKYLSRFDRAPRLALIVDLLSICDHRSARWTAEPVRRLRQHAGLFLFSVKREWFRSG